MLYLEGFGDAVRRDSLEPCLLPLVLAHTLCLALVLPHTAIDVVSQRQIILYVGQQRSRLRSRRKLTAVIWGLTSALRPTRVATSRGPSAPLYRLLGTPRDASREAGWKSVYRGAVRHLELFRILSYVWLH